MRLRSTPELVVGSYARLAPGGPVYRVVWRGRQPMPRHSDWPGDMAVYRLDDGHWDCYYAYQLHPARPWDSGTPDPQAGT